MLRSLVLVIVGLLMGACTLGQEGSSCREGQTWNPATQRCHATTR
jgi:hypothetical protein